MMIGAIMIGVAGAVDRPKCTFTDRMAPPREKTLSGALTMAFKRLKMDCGVENGTMTTIQNIKRKGRRHARPSERLSRSKTHCLAAVIKRRRGELLVEIYNGAYHPHHPMYDATRRELDILDGKV